jgi:hypothetical protein
MVMQERNAPELKLQILAFSTVTFDSCTAATLIVTPCAICVPKLSHIGHRLENECFEHTQLFQTRFRTYKSEI